MKAANLSSEVFDAFPLARNEARRAYPLVRLFHPNLSLNQWLHHVQILRRKSSGVIAIQDKRGCVHATFVYTVDVRVARAPLLRVSEMMVWRMLGNLVNQAIMDCIDRLAIETDSETIEISLPSAVEYAVDPIWRNSLKEAGFRVRTTSMIRRLAPGSNAGEHGNAT